MGQGETSGLIDLADVLSWWQRVDASKLDEETRYRILNYVVEKFGSKRVLEETGFSRVTLWRLLKKESPVKPEYVQPLLKLLTVEEFEELVSRGARLRAIGILKSDGTIDYSLALEILSLAKTDEYLKNAILRFAVENFREDLKRMLGLGFMDVKLTWTDDFEVFLTKLKKRRKVLDPETIRYYKNLFKKHLEGRELTIELVEEISKHPNGWLRNIFRHYIQYLYYKRKISPETYGWILEVVPSRGYRVDVRPYQISVEDVKKTLAYLKSRHKVYYAIYMLMLESGARLEHSLQLLSSWNPEEVVYIESVDFETERLVCFENKGFCRYYLGIKGTQKPCEWLYFSTETLKFIQELAPRKISRHSVRKYAERHGLVLPKILRKLSWRILVTTTSREVARFIQSRFGELKVSEARYSDLLAEADKLYPKYLDKLKAMIRA